MLGAVRRASVIIAGCLLAAVASTGLKAQSWTADNGNGTFTNPLFYDEFSDPDMIRVGNDFYLAGTTMHCTPGLVILHSRDLVNWKFMSYCFDRFDMGGEFRLENGREAYGQGIWAPCIRYHEGKFYVFSNVPEGNYFSAVPLHQGGIVDLPNGEWWGFSMTDFMAVGRTTCLSPVTWVDGWPYFGLPGNLGRSPRTWFKPNVGEDVRPHAPYERNDGFDGPDLKPVWQWNHEPVDGKWKLSGGKLRLHTLPAKDFLWARNTLTQRGVGPVSVVTVKVDVSRLKADDVAGLGLLNMPYAWIGILKKEDEYVLRFCDQAAAVKVDTAAVAQLYLRASGDFHKAVAQFSYSVDGRHYTPLGGPVKMPYQLKTFQGTRYALFAYNTKGRKGGYAMFDDFTLDEPMADRSGNLPLGKVITLVNLATGNPAWANPHGMLHSVSPRSPEAKSGACRFRVHDRARGRVALEAMDGSGFVTVVGQGLSSDVRLLKQEAEGSLFLWQDMLHGESMLLSLKTNRYVGIHPSTGEPYGADWPGALPDRCDGTVFRWETVGE